MGDVIVEPKVEVGYTPELTPEEKVAADRMWQYIQQQNAEAQAKQTDPSTRPGFAGITGAPADTTFDLKRLQPFQRERVGSNGDVVEAKSGGFLPPTPQSPQEREESLKGFNVNLFPKGGIENFSPYRWAMAVQNSYTPMGNQAYSKFAPWESAYYDATTKAMGDQVSGQDGGFIAPEEWSTRYIDMIYVSTVTSRLPLTRFQMSTRVTHMPKLVGAITVSYGAENSALTPTTAQWAQASWTARKQGILMQVSNELIRDSNPGVQQLLNAHATRYAAIDMDTQILLGNGQGGAPVGIINATNVTSGTFATAGSPLYTEMDTGIFNVENLNASTNVPLGQANVTGIVGAVALKRQILNMTDTTSRPLYDYGFNYMRGANRKDGSTMLDGLFAVDTWVLSNIVRGASNTNKVFLGDWQHVYIGQRMDVEILASNVAGTAFASDQTWIRFIQRYDVVVAHPEAFFIYTNG